MISLLHKINNMSLNMLAIILCSALFFVFVFYNLNSDRADKTDRSSTYNVRVFPADADDSTLALLPKEAFSYVSVIDAGSSGCRCHVYRYGKLGSVEGPLYILPIHVSKKVKPGLSSFAEKPSEAGVSLADLVTFLKDTVPASDWAVTPIWLKATAGLRMLPEEKSEAILNSVRLYLSNTPFMFKSTFAKIIPGKEEGAFGWLAFNYLKRIVGPKQVAGAKPYAVVEMGGASSQVTQMAPDQISADQIPKDFRFDFEVEGRKFSLYTYSYLGFGAEQARESLNKLLANHYIANHQQQATTTTSSSPSSSSSSSSSGGANSSNNNNNNVLKDPCLNTGYSRSPSQKRIDVYDGVLSNPSPPAQLNLHVEGEADSKGTCLKVISRLFPENNNCPSSSSPSSSSTFTSSSTKSNSGSVSKDQYSFNCVFQPQFLKDSDRFLVFENFYYIASGIGVLPKGHASTAVFDKTKFPLITSPNELKESTMDVCGAPYDKLQSSYPLDGQPKELNTKWCFTASYAVSLLLDGLKLSGDKELTIQKEVEGNEIEWALGAAYKETADFLKKTNLRPYNN